jgi:hypothetical protein
MSKTKTQTQIIDNEMGIVPLVHNTAPVINHIMYFTTFGQHDTLMDEKGSVNEAGYPCIIPEMHQDIYLSTNTLAKIVSTTNKVRYLIKADHLGKLYNPLGMYTEGRPHNKQLKHAGKEDYSYSEVNHKVFMFYLSFLKTKNQAYLHNAERERV